MKDSGLILQVWDVWGCLHKSESLFEETLSDHDKLYESSRRKPGWRFTAGVKYGVSRELGLFETENDKSIRFGSKTEISMETNNSLELSLFFPGRADWDLQS